MTLTCRGILFDLDGTLIDSTPAVDRAWTRWSQSHGLNPGEVLHRIHGRRASDSIRLVAPHLDAEVETRALEEMESTDTEGVVPVPGALEFLSSLPEGSWGIVTSGSPPVANARLNAGRIPKPRVFVTADMIEHGKPAPDAFLKGAELLGFAPRDLAAFEDAPAGIEAATRAGMAAVGISTAYGSSELAQAVAVIPDFVGVQVQVDSDGLLRLSLPECNAPNR